MKVSINQCPPGAFMAGGDIWVPDKFRDTQGTIFAGGWYLPTAQGFAGPRKDYDAYPASSIRGRPGTGYEGLQPDKDGWIDVPADVESYDLGNGYIGFRPKPRSTVAQATTNPGVTTSNTSNSAYTWGAGGNTTMDRNAMLQFIESLLRGQAVVRYNVAVYGSATGVAASGSPAAVLATSISASSGEATAADLTSTNAFRAAQKTIQDAYAAYLRTEQTISFIKSAMTGDPMLMLASILATGGVAVG